MLPLPVRSDMKECSYMEILYSQNKTERKKKTSVAVEIRNNTHSDMFV